MTYALIDGPEVEVLSLAEVKAHLRLVDESEDLYLTGLIATAREHLERDLGICLIDQTWRLYLDEWPKGGVVKITRFPIQSIERLVIYDAEGAAIEVTQGGHVLRRHKSPSEMLLDGAAKTLFTGNGAELDFRAGFGEAPTDVPDGLKRAMLLHIAHMFAFRGVATVEEQPLSIPPSYERLIAPFRQRGL
jgi:uncharacterized phiE125 gp8 family phage protein